MNSEIARRGQTGLARARTADRQRDLPVHPE